MMRVSREEAARNRARVVETAGLAFRERGYDGVGVAGLMSAAGLTHGGFYNQFESKEALVVEATAEALAGNLASWRAISKGAADPAAALRQWYLSSEYVGGVRYGCVFAALAAEAPRHGEALRHVFAEALETFVDQLSAPSASRTPSRAEAMAWLSQMVGALILARAVGDPDLAEDILTSSRPDCAD